MITLLTGNSRILLTVNDRGNWSQLYYPYAGQFQHLNEARVGLFDEASKDFQWLGTNETEPTTQAYLGPTNAGRTRHKALGAEVIVDDMVHPNLDLIVRRIEVTNREDRPRRLRLFHYQSLTIMESLYQDTAYWDAARRTINHYKRRFYFQFWGRPDFDAFTCGEHTLKGLKGSWVDAEDGELLGNPISHGAADSCVQWNLDVAPGQSRLVHLLVMLGRSRHDVNEFHRRLVPLDPSLVTDEAIKFWRNWIENKRVAIAPDLSERAHELYRRSVFVLSDCSSENGAIVASPDPRTLKSGGDNYNYCWWRDGSYVAKAMDECGLRQNARRFLKFAAECQQEEGYFLHRHFLDGTVGSTWHPPPFLQVDQTASVISAVWHHYKQETDLDELLGFWPLVRRSADFLMTFLTPEGLPQPSFDLWEERKTINTYTVAAVVHGLQRAVRAGQELGKRTAFWEAAEQRMRESALQRLWDPKRNVFFKSVEPLDETLDASTLLTIKLGLLPPNDPRAAGLVDAIEKRLWSPRTGGLARYEGDRYYGHENPWLICTLWLAEAHLLLGNAARCRELIEWVAGTAGPTGLLAEQLDAATGNPTSVTPLVWSHSTFLDTVNKYTRRPNSPDDSPPRT